ncbi:MAG: diguanylate cyclase [Planctomycetota bacterium]
MKRKHILLVAQQSPETVSLGRQLTREGSYINLGKGLAEALEILEVQRFDAIVVDDAVLGGAEAHGTGKFWASAALLGTPIIVLASAHELQRAAGLLEDWAKDFVKKPVLARELLLRCDIALERKEEQDQLYDLATRDPLTRLFNRRYLMDFLVGQVCSAVRGNGKIALILCDLDNFKAVNDTYGHLVGDEVLAMVGQILKEGTRRSDVCARYGGEEFAIAAPGETAQECAQLAERLREQIRKADWAGLGEDLAVTASFGVAEFDAARMEQSVAALVAAADLALYAAKRAGKNQTAVHGEGELARALGAGEATTDGGR